MKYGQEQAPRKWQNRAGLVVSSYRTLAFAIGTTQLLIFPSVYYLVIPPYILAIIVGAYTLLKALLPFRPQARPIVSYTVLATDFAVCAFLVTTTGVLYSPFLLYTLAPVLTSALFLNIKTTSIIAALSAAYVIGMHLGNPFFPTGLYRFEVSYFWVYVTASGLTAGLPYLVNSNLRQKLHQEEMIQERRKLSHEIHDGIAQTASALRWQVQLVRRRLDNMNIDLDEVGELEKLAEKGQQDTRESLELLRNYTGDGSFLPYLKDYLEHLKEDTNINFQLLNILTGELHLDPAVEIEILRICQEALTNIRRHSEAHNIQVRIESVNKYLKVTITDDGCGFDAFEFDHDGVQFKGHGLAVMRERAESIGGKFRLVSLPGRGTEVQVEVPANTPQGRWLWQNQ